MNQNLQYKLLDQKPYCCVPTCICMILDRRKINHGTQDEVGYDLGLIVPEEKANIYTKVRTGKKPISGYGTQVGKKQYSINNFFKKNNILLKETYFYTDEISNIKEFIISNIEKNNDIIVCFNNEKLHGTGNRGHVSLIQSIKDNNIFLIDPGIDVPKIRKVTLENLINSIKHHGKQKRGGFWVISE